jgi:hypothetical protein
METKMFIIVFTRGHELFLSWARSIQSPPLSYFLKVHFSIILPSTNRSSKWSLYLRFLHQTLCAHLLPPIRASNQKAGFIILQCNDSAWRTQVQAVLHLYSRPATPSERTCHFPYNVFIPPEFCWATVELPSCKKRKEYRNDRRLRGEM